MSSNRDVLFILSTLEVGGSESKIVRIANALSTDGYKVTVAYLNPPESLLDRIEKGVEVVSLGRKGKYSLSSLRRLSHLLRVGYKSIISVNLYPLLYVVPATKISRTDQLRTICLINTTDFNPNQTWHGRLYTPLLRCTDMLVFGCRAQMLTWIKRYKLSSKRSRYIYNGVSTQEFCVGAFGTGESTFRSDYSIPEDAVVFGSVGRFAPEKNFAFLVEAIRRIRATGRPAFLVLAGDGSEKISLMRKTRQCGLEDCVVLPGFVDDVRYVLKAMDVFVLPSRAVETFSNAALEAMSMSRPVVLSDIGGAEEMIEHGRTGFLYHPDDMETLEQYLVQLFDSRVLRERLGKAARAVVENRFEFGVMLEHYKSIIRCSGRV